jgi:hypothetical protein
MKLGNGLAKKVSNNLFVMYYWCPVCNDYNCKVSRHFDYEEYWCTVCDFTQDLYDNERGGNND